MDLKPVYDPEHRIIINAFLRNKVKESNARGAVLGLSGGLDSSVVAALAAEAIDPKQVHCLILPYDDEIEGDSVEHATLMVKSFKLSHQVISIRESVDSIVNSFPDTTVKGTQDNGVDNNLLSLGNVKARMRMIALYYYANRLNYLVVGTSNKSELMIGYFTKYGDGGADAMPIGDLYKTQVYALARELGIPEQIILKPPYAGLISSQSDEDDLGISYAELDRILFGIELCLGLSDIADITKIPIETIERIQKMVQRSSHKRYLGMIPKLGIRTPAFDWRENTSLFSLSHEPLE